MPLDRVAARLRQRIPATAWAAFLSCFLSGYLIHLFALTNLIPNSDGLSRVFDPAGGFSTMPPPSTVLLRCQPSSAFCPWCFSPWRRPPLF